jgi:tRNA uridine 5-carboxymethylaminomethyl modification enzyme
MATLQFRMLNRSKGPAVWAPRAQCDRALYKRAVRSLLERHATLQTIQGTVARLILDDASRTVLGIETLEGRRFGAKAVVVTSGTFGRGRIHIGTTTQMAGGRAGEGPATHLSEQLERMGLEVGRFKTGTPPRIDGRTVDYARVERQDSELADFQYRWSHFWSRFADGRDRFTARANGDGEGRPGAHHDVGGEPPPPLPQLPCWITHLDAPGKARIADAIGLSAMYGGAIASRGPRYCPSVEDKIVKFPDAERHQLFLEPEGLETTEMYVNGLSTSLPADVQLDVLRTVRGLERVAMTRAGYAIEYDYYPPTQLDTTLRVRTMQGLWFAGQVNGTTGYEEAAGQGLVAGLNAALAALARPPLVLGRETSYVGVLVDDIVTRGVDEPYRLFTSRSEFRLTVRQDNALRRLSAIALELGLYDEGERALVRHRLDAEDIASTLARQTSIRPEQAATVLEPAGSAAIPHSVKLADLARRQGVTLHALFAAAGVGADLPAEAVVTAELQLKYAGYFERERTHAERMRRMGDFALDESLPYEEFRSLSYESRQKLGTLRPRTLAQASRVPGVSPSDLQNLVIEVERWRRARVAH